MKQNYPQSWRDVRVIFVSCAQRLLEDFSATVMACCSGSQHRKRDKLPFVALFVRFCCLYKRFYHFLQPSLCHVGCGLQRLRLGSLLAAYVFLFNILKRSKTCPKKNGMKNPKECDYDDGFVQELKNCCVDDCALPRRENWAMGSMLYLKAMIPKCDHEC